MIKKPVAVKRKFHVKSGDTVKVIAGNSKGMTGKILEVYTATERVKVEGAQMVTKHLKPNAQSPQGSIVKKEGTIHISNVMLVDPATGETTRTGRKENEKGKLQRYSKETGKFIA